MANEYPLTFGWKLNKTTKNPTRKSNKEIAPSSIEQFVSEVDSKRNKEDLFLKDAHLEDLFLVDKELAIKRAAMIVSYLLRGKISYLKLSKISMESMKILVDVLTDPDCKLRELDLSECCIGSGGLRMLAEALEIKNCPLLILDLSCSLNDFDKKAIKRLGDALGSGAKLQILEICTWNFTFGSLGSLGSLKSLGLRELESEILEDEPLPNLPKHLHHCQIERQTLLHTIAKSSVKHLHLSVTSKPNPFLETPVPSNVRNQLRDDFDLLLNHLETLSLSGFALNWFPGLEKSNLSLRHLQLFKAPQTESFFENLFGSNKCSIVELDLTNCGTERYKLVLDIVSSKYNNALEILKAESIPRDLELRCQAILSHNKKLRSLMSDQPTKEPSAAKLFICGHSRVGKTTFTNNLNRNIRIPGCLQRYPSTEGVHMTSLKFGDKKAIIFDIAGQNEYHVFHHYFVRGSDKDAFLVMCKAEEQDPVKKSLRYWLRFIVAHRASSLIRPKVIIALNFFTTGNTQSDMDQVAILRTIKIREKFKDVIDFGNNDENVFGFMATNCQQLQSCKRRIKHIVIELLQHTKIVSVCDDLIRFLQTKREPIMLTSNLAQEFNNWLIKWFNLPHKISEDVIKGALIQLHDMGEVVYFEEEKIVILDPKWFNQDVIALFINNNALDTTHNQQSGLHRIEDIHFINNNALDTTHNQQLGLHRIEDIQSKFLHLCPSNKETQNAISRLICGKREKEEGLVGKQLELHVLQCLHRMGVILPQDKNWSREWSSPPKKLIIPTLLINNEPPRWVSNASDKFYGRRYECKDKKTTLLPSGLFSMLQGRLEVQHHTRTEHQSKGDRESFSVGYGWIKFQIDKISMVLLFGGETNAWTDRHWIDMRIRITEDQTLVNAEKLFLVIRDEIFSTCYDQKMGCPNLVLFEKVIDPMEVKKLTNGGLNCTEDLHNVMKIVENKGLAYLYQWNEHHEIPIMDLMFPNEISEHEQKIISNLRNIRHDIELNVSTFSESTAIEKDYEPKPVTNEHLLEAIHQFKYDLFGRLDDMTGKIIQQLSKFGEVVQIEVKSTINYSRNIVMRLLDGSFPKFSYFDPKAGWQFMKLMGQSVVTLHAMCEAKSPPHIVRGQKGVQIIMCPDWFRKIAPIIGLTIRVVWCAAQVFASIHSLNLLSINDTGFSDDWFKIQNWNDVLAWMTKGCTNLQDVNWQEIEPSLLKELYSRVYKDQSDEQVRRKIEVDFGLHPLNCEDGKVVWTCSHCQNAIKNK